MLRQTIIIATTALSGGASGQNAKIQLQRFAGGNPPLVTRSDIKGDEKAVKVKLKVVKTILQKTVPRRYHRDAPSCDGVNIVIMLPDVRIKP